MKHYHSLKLFLIHGLAAAIPLNGRLDVRHTTETAEGGIVDWIPIQSQVPNGNVASPPPLPIYNTMATFNTSTPQPYDSEKGPEGTVPILRSARASVNKQPPPGIGSENDHVKRAVGDHWYASSAQTVANHGGSASYSLFKAYTESGADFSLLQAAIIRTGVPKPGDNGQQITQTVEAGWINYPNQVAAPHLFVFFTTNGYSAQGNNIGGWNRDVAGWVQTDNTIFPGVSFNPLSSRGGSQYDLSIRWYLYQGNWWLSVLDRYIGYYPASLFGAGTDASRSLQQEASHINYYGEIYDSHPQLTRTDMGSGNWPESGFGQSGYIRNMVYTDTSNVDRTYDGSRGIIISDANRYRMTASWNSGSNWGSYFYLGGPGAGGVIDG
ncbi:unnamed protein product [Periconia digitata]|uniref:Neprosin PEP catalytic domain-containing protein n=1 Tax=Periconia digitata TaxID=1303443 RepID=A0A9W4UJ40_9PLEO|nr:unnamed protein product [Periconia digitata]